MQELEAQRLAIGAAKDGDDLAQRGELQPEHVVEEDLAVVVGLAEAVGARIELLVVAERCQPQRVEIGVQVAARPVGADQHQGADRVARGALNVGGGQVDAPRLRLRPDLVADRLVDFAPVAVEGGDELAARQLRPVGPFPRGAARVSFDVARIVLHALEKRPPLGIDRARVGLVARVEVFDVGAIATVEKGREGKGRVGVLTGHREFPVGVAYGREHFG